MIKEDNSITSEYVSFLLVNPKTRNLIMKYLVEPLLDKFLSKSNIFNTESYLNKDLFFADCDFSDLDFSKIDLKQFYRTIIQDFKRIQDNQKVSINKKFSLTLDENMTPYLCNETHIKYGTISIGQKIVWIFFFIDIKDIFKLIRGKAHLLKKGANEC